MKVSLLNYTQNAKEILIFSKKIRLMNSADDFNKIINMEDNKKDEEIKYVFNTIGSSLEFVDYVFLIEEVTRAFTHQLIRHRVGTSFAQQSLRTVDMGDFDYLTTGSCLKIEEYKKGMDEIKKYYKNCLDSGANPQDARGLLPTNILTNILFKINLRALQNMMLVRLCFRTQGEFQNVAKKIREEVLRVHPWTDKILKAYCGMYGICQFPNFKECPIQPYTAKVNTNYINELLDKINFEATPKEEK